jgi:hypothetical protein
MTADMKFKIDVWRTLTSTQQDAIKALRKAKKPFNTNRAAHNSERTLPLVPALPPTDVTPVPADITPPPDPGQSIRAALSTATARTSPSTTSFSQISHQSSASHVHTHQRLNPIPVAFNREESGC